MAGFRFAILDGKKYRKRNLVYAVVEKYVKEHNRQISYTTLKEIFPDTLQGSYGVIKNIQEYKNLSQEQQRDRFFDKPIKILSDEVYVCTQWGDDNQSGPGNIRPFIAHVNKVLNYDIKIQEINATVETTKLKNNDNGYISLNQILYGPPGTGKTYNTINRALEIIDNEVPEDRDEAKARFEELSRAGQIEFVTFHQSYGYEEFVEGIKASTYDGEISYDVGDGIFKKISIECLYNSLAFKNIQSDLTYNELYIALIEKYKRNKFLTLKSKESKTIEVRGISNKENLYCYHEGSTVKHTVSKERLKKIYDQYNQLEKLEELSGLHEEFTKIIGGANQTVYWSVLNELLHLKKELKHEDIDEEISYEMKKDIVLGKNKFDFSDDPKKYILIIDEINRGNISKIFGELITLIEPSKRIGTSEEIRLRLPYSNDEFGVPSNLYIIGTMNTADRSIALMDTALRRRFEFVEMMPDYEVLKEKVGVVSGVDISSFLQKVNARVEYLYDRDHTIGHAYFMDLNAGSSLDELNAVMRNKIIPLLQEYFYDDWEKIKLVLNDGFIHSTRVDASALFESIDDEYIEEDKLVYSILDVFEREAYLRLCQTR